MKQTVNLNHQNQRGVNRLQKEIRSLEIAVKSSFWALHFWKDAPEEFSFLRHPHRHVFHVVLVLSVPENETDRHLEFFSVQRDLSSFVAKWEGETVPFSCEDFAVQICRWAKSFYKVKRCAVKVQEDEENFARYSIESVA